MKVRNMISRSSGKEVANQFIIDTDSGDRLFQSYNSVIVKVTRIPGQPGRRIFLDENKWDYSITTNKYRNQFLGKTKAETRKKIASGEYVLVDLNQ